MNEIEKKSKGILRGRGGPGRGQGRPKGRKDSKTLEIEAAAKKYAGDALKALASVLKSRFSSDGAKIAAAVALLDRGYGRPRQSLEHTGADGGPIETKEMGAVRERIDKRLAGINERFSALTGPLVTKEPATNGKNGKKHG